MRRIVGAIAAALTTLLLAAPAAAADLPPRVAAMPPVPTMPSWQFQATMYGWATALDGDVGVRYRQPIGVNVDFSDILKNLKGAFMGAFLAKNDTWMFLGDVLWSKIGTKSTTRFGGQLEFEQTFGMLSGYVGYRLPIGTPSLDVRVLGGVRGQRITADIKHFGILPFFDRSGSATKEWIDPVIGLSAQYAIDKNWFVNVIADVGGFGVGSELTSQGLLTVGYKWTETISTSIGYRALYTDYKKDGFTYNTTMHGVFLGFGVHF